MEFRHLGGGGAPRRHRLRGFTSYNGGGCTDDQQLPPHPDPLPRVRGRGEKSEYGGEGDRAIVRDPILSSRRGRNALRGTGISARVSARCHRARRLKPPLRQKADRNVRPTVCAAQAIALERKKSEYGERREEKYRVLNFNARGRCACLRGRRGRGRGWIGGRRRGLW
jgi:hypothetical protein